MQRSESGSQLLTEDLRLFPRREVPALRQLVVMDELGIGPLRPTPRSLVDLLRKDTYGSRNGDAEVIEEGALVFRIERAAEPAVVLKQGEGNFAEMVAPREVPIGLP